MLYSHWSNSVQKTGRKDTKYSRNETMLKFGLLAKAIAFAWPITCAKYLIWVKKLNCLKQVKINSVFTLEYNPVQKTARKKTKLSRNDTMLKIGHLLEAIASAKYSIWAKKFKLPKTSKNRFCIHIGVILFSHLSGIFNY